MNATEPKAAGKTERTIPISRWWLFPIGVLVVYGFLALISPDKASEAFQGSGHVLKSLAWPMAMVFGAMFALNLLLKPSHIVRFLGRGAGIRGLVLAVIAGIVSVGPIYAWYPLLRDLKEKGAADSLISIFLYNRAVKPFLLPVMIDYFGWKYVVILTVLTVLSSIIIGYVVNSSLRIAGVPAKRLESSRIKRPIEAKSQVKCSRCLAFCRKTIARFR